MEYQIYLYHLFSAWMIKVMITFFSSIMLENINIQIPVAFDRVTPSKKMTSTTKTLQYN